MESKTIQTKQTLALAFRSSVFRLIIVGQVKEQSTKSYVLVHFKKYLGYRKEGIKHVLRTRGGGRVSWDEVREWNGHIYTAKCKIDS